ncbi:MULTISPECIES: hypothetical protein [Paenibacillus]|uniref:DUF5590 domain-containing protein n=1 Tax=Paenibacillus lactis TaxID=228574 RepID=A0ABS4FF29_9BACL|nr:hypothetical protein [Paenibacillus lactis]MBP1894865.1 hypothetical protein [Paenibacillus lactis]GIO92128.1 hypothetical protein J31TS3_33550 [Paenibacillus lactis]HAF96897.1 hypothetical protein [Paenibacillus lactis]
MKIQLKFTLLVCLLISILSGCTKAPDSPALENQLKSVLEKASISFDKILHYEVVDNGIVVFYTHDDSLNESYIEYNSGKWKLVNSSGSASLVDKDIPISYVWDYSETVPFRIVYGSINQGDIEQIKVNGEVTNKITLSDGLTFWYLILEEPYSADSKLEAFSANGDLIYEKK